MSKLQTVSSKSIQKALHKSTSAQPEIGQIHQALSMAHAMDQYTNGGAPSVKNQLFPSARKLRRAKEKMQRKEPK